MLEENITLQASGTGGTINADLHIRISQTNMWTPSLPDFSLMATPATILAGAYTPVLVTLTSLNNFSGAVSIDAISIPPSINTSITVQFPTLTVPSDEVIPDQLVVKQSTLGPLAILVTATNGSITHKTVLTIRVVALTIMINKVSPNPATTGETVTITFGITSPSTISQITVNWGDGTSTQPSPMATSDTHTYPTTLQMLSRIFTINVTATNVAGQGYALAQETVNDRPPTVTVTGVSPSTVNPGQTATLNFTASDPDGIISLVNVTWGDGSTPDLIVPIRSRSMCQSMSANTSECTLPVGAMIVIKAESTSNIQVPPTSYSSLDCPGVSLDPQGTIIVFYYPVNPSFLVVHRVYREMNISGQIYYDTKGDANACDDGVQVPASEIVGVYQYTLGSSDLTTIKTYDTHTYSRAGSYTITVTAIDDSGSQSYTTTTETIISPPPIVTITHVTPTQPTTGTTITLTFNAKDPDGTISSISINWGDGSPPDSLPGSATSDTHSYTKAGSYTIIITATDNSGSSTQASNSPLTVSAPLSPAPPVPTILGLAKTEFYSLIGIVLAVIAATTFLYWRRIRKTSPALAPSLA
jgi:hypothetical protein